MPKQDYAAMFVAIQVQPRSYVPDCYDCFLDYY